MMKGYTVDTYRNMRVSSVPLRISGREDGVDKNKGTNDLSTQSGTFVVARLHKVGTTSVPVVVCFLEPLGKSSATDCTSTLCYHVHESPYQRHLASQEQPKCHSWVDVSSCNIPNPDKVNYKQIIAEGYEL